MELLYTDYARLAAMPAPDGEELGPAELLGVLRRAALADGMPFILGTDGGYDDRLNGFFRELPLNGVRSPRSWTAYATDLLTFARYMETVHGLTLWDVTRDHLAAYYAVRRGLVPATDPQDGAPPGDNPQVSAASWNRSVAAIDRFYRWALGRAYIDALPYSSRELTCLINGHDVTVHVNELTERGARDSDIKYVSIDDYLTFRDVGLRGLSPSGEPDPSFRGRNGERNATFADLLVTTGLRLTEAGSLLVTELPREVPRAAPGDPAIKNLPLDLAPATAKGRSGRVIRLPLRILRRIASYAALERANAIARAAARGAYERPGARVLVLEVTRQRCTVLRGGRPEWQRVAEWTPERRRAAYLRGPDGAAREPLALWLTEQGLPMVPATWEAIFEDACARCRHHGFDIAVTPHTLRHTYATYMLAQLIREQIGKLFESPPDADAIRGAAYQRLAGDPLRTLQKLLGHRSITSTFIYLSNVMEAQRLVDDAIDRYAAEFAGLTGKERDRDA